MSHDNTCAYSIIRRYQDIRKGSSELIQLGSMESVYNLSRIKLNWRMSK